MIPARAFTMDIKIDYTLASRTTFRVRGGSRGKTGIGMMLAVMPVHGTGVSSVLLLSRVGAWPLDPPGNLASCLTLRTG